MEECHKRYADCEGCKNFIQKFENIVTKVVNRWHFNRNTYNLCSKPQSSIKSSIPNASHCAKNDIQSMKMSNGEEEHVCKIATRFIHKNC